MSEQRIGTCGNCGGSVVGYRGAWMGVNPPPHDRCSCCGAVPKGQSDVIEMEPRLRRIPYTSTTDWALDGSGTPSWFIPNWLHPSITICGATQ